MSNSDWEISFRSNKLPSMNDVQVFLSKYPPEPLVALTSIGGTPSDRSRMLTRSATAFGRSPIGVVPPRLDRACARLGDTGIRDRVGRGLRDGRRVATCLPGVELRSKLVDLGCGLGCPALSGHLRHRLLHIRWIEVLRGHSSAGGKDVGDDGYAELQLGLLGFGLRGGDIGFRDERRVVGHC
jgi:hypothetical protein